MDRKCAGVIQPQWDGDARLETSIYPDLDPPPFLVKIPRQHDTRLHDLKDILSAGHRPVDVLSRFAGMELGKFVSTHAVLSYGGGIRSPS